MIDSNWYRRRDGEWARRLFAMRRDANRPHYKPALLLAALDLLDEGRATPQQVALEALVAAFEQRLNAVGLVGSDRAFMPAWHLAVDSGTPHPFWRIQWRTTPVSQEMPGTNATLLRDASAVRFLDEFAEDLASPRERWLARQNLYDLLEADGRPNATLLLHAWPAHLEEMKAEESQIKELLERTFVLDDDQATRVWSSRGSVLRDRALRNLVLPAYGHRCALCRDTIRWRNASLVEASHIKPRSLLGVDDVRNAVALCPSHHWAFDRFLWTIGDANEVLVRPDEPGADLSALAPFRDGQRLELPADVRCHPHPLATAWHRERFHVDRAG